MYIYIERDIYIYKERDIKRERERGKGGLWETKEVKDSGEKSVKNLRERQRERERERVTERE